MVFAVWVVGFGTFCAWLTFVAFLLGGFGGIWCCAGLMMTCDGDGFRVWIWVDGLVLLCSLIWVGVVRSFGMVDSLAWWWDLMVLVVVGDWLRSEFLLFGSV